MKKIICLFALVILLSGCASLENIRATNRENLMKLSIGMNKQEVLNVMGIQTIRAEGTTVNNPYRSEIIQGKDKTFEVLYYYTDLKASDSAITDDELTPVVFDNSKIIGWGWSFLQDNSKKYEVRMR